MKRIAAILLIFLSTSVLFSQKQDTVKHRIVRQWNLSHDFTEEVTVPFDTVFSLFNYYRIADKYSPLNATLGNYGLPFYQINFFDRITDPDKFLSTYYSPLMWQPENYIFMNTQVPFTELLWTFGGPRETAEQTFRVRHSQNINRYFNFGLIFDIVYSLGEYSYQRAIDKDFTFYTSYTREKYKFYFAVAIDNMSANENGGIADPAQLQEFSTTRDIGVRLGGLDLAQSVLKNRNFLFVQKYTIGGGKPVEKDTSKTAGPRPFSISGTFSHILNIDINRRTYYDKSPTSGFYDSIYTNKIYTYDSLYSRSIKNTVRFDFATDQTRKFRLGGGVGIRNELFRYSQIVPTHDTATIADTARWNRMNNALVGKLYNNIGDKFRWTATGELFLTGYRAGDFNLSGIITKSFDWKKGMALWNITGGVSSAEPSFWFEQWGSNHFEWHNNFNKVFRLDLGTEFSYPARNAEMKLNYAIIDNYTDFDTLALPAQHTGGLSVVSLFLRKDLRAWKFHLTTDLLVQKSSNTSVLDLPLATVRAAGYFEHLFIFRKTNGMLNMQLGVDVTYNTLYHPYAYMPATGRFYRQDKDFHNV
jgi:hypothetical protein